MIRSSSRGVVGPHCHPGAVVQQNLELLDVFARFAAEHRVRSTRVVADHSAQRAVPMRCRIRRKGQLMLFRRIAQLIIDQPRLYPRVALFRIQLNQPVQVLRKVEHHRHIAGLPRKRGPGAAPKNRHVQRAADRHRLHHILHRAGNHHTDRHLPVVRQIRRVDCPRSIVKAHLRLCPTT